MANQRSPGQKLVGFWASDEFRKAVDEACSQEDEQSSQFIRKAVIEKIQRMGIPISKIDARPPSRQGKGGPKKPSPSSLEEREQKAALEAAESEHARETDSKSEPKSGAGEPNARSGRPSKGASRRTNLPPSSRGPAPGEPNE